MTAKLFSLTIFLFLVLISSLSAQEQSSLLKIVVLPGAEPALGNHMITLYDNTSAVKENVTPDWGFSLYINYKNHHILFDGGASTQILEKNAAALGIDLRKIEVAVVSHCHPDHTTGINYLLKINPKVTVYVPLDGNFAGRFQHDYIVFADKDTTITDGMTLIYTTSPYMGYYYKYPPYESNPVLTPLPELSLAITNNNNEIVLISGCSHSGIANIIQETKHHLKKNILFVIGGFHLMPFSDTYILDLAKRMKDEFGVKIVCPTHCTGEDATAIFKKYYKGNFVAGGVGTKIVF